MRFGSAAVVLLLAATAASAGVPDHMQCYDLANGNLRGLRGVVDLDTPAFGLAPGCKISRAKLYCVPAAASVRPGTLSDGGRPVDDVPFPGPAAGADRICYNVQCPHPTGAVPDQLVTDRFGTHDLKHLRTELVCTPATGGTLPPPPDGFQIEFPEVDVYPGQDISYCYYFRTPNAETLAVKRFTSQMGPFGQQMIAFTTTTDVPHRYPVDRLHPGEVSAADCSPLPTGNVVPNWLYEAHEPTSELAFPSDDGSGKPVALEIPPLSSGFILLHVVNTSDEVVKTKATLNVEALASPVYTRTEPYTAFTDDFAIPPLSNGVVVGDACATPPGTQFWRLSTLTHTRATAARIVDGPTTVLETLDWAHPEAETRLAPPFRTFASNALGYACTYDNAENRTVRRGDSYQTDEECLAVGYFFPATRPLRCFNGNGPY